MSRAPHGPRAGRKLRHFRPTIQALEARQLLAVTIADSGFESSLDGASNNYGFYYNPPGTPWTFNNVAGFIKGADYGTTPQGRQAALIQRDSSISQVVPNWDAGSYRVSFAAAQRNSSNQDFQVLIDDAVVGSFQPSFTSYRYFTTPAFTVTAGDHALTFRGLNSAPGDNTVFLDDVAATPATPGVPIIGDPGFEMAPIADGGYAYAPADTYWNFETSSGVSSYYSNFTGYDYIPAPDGTHVAFLQGSGGLFQTVGDFSTGRYQVSFAAAQRRPYQTSVQDFQVLFDGSVIATFTPSSTSYQTYTTPDFAVMAGQHILGFRGLNTAGGDNTAFIDQVSVNRIGATNPVGTQPNYELSATTFSASAIKLHWSLADFATGYTLERRTGGLGEWTYLAQVGQNVSSFLDTNLSESTTYDYRIRALGSGVPSDYGYSATCLTMLTAPTGLVGTAVSKNRIDLTWSDNSTAESGYLVEASLDGATNWFQVGSPGSGSTSLIIMGTFAPATIYYFHVRATAPANTSFDSISIAVSTKAVPASPVLTAVTAQSATSIALVWSDVADETSYRVDRSLDGGSTWNVAGISSADVTNFTDANLQSEQSYTYRVVASNAFGDSAPSNARFAITSLVAPDHLVATVSSATSINIFWSGVNGATGYVLEQSVTGTSDWQEATRPTSGTTSTVVRGLSPSTLYYFRIYATSASGNTPYSNIANASTGSASTISGPNVVSIVALDASAAEAGHDPATFRVSRTGSTAAALTVSYSFGGTANYSSGTADYSGLPMVDGFVVPNYQVTIPVGMAYADFSITPITDILAEGIETVSISLKTSPNYGLADISTASATIADDPSNNNVVSIVAIDATASEAGRDPATFRVSRTGSTAAALTVSYSFGGTAGDADYTGLPYVYWGPYTKIYQVTIPAGQSYVDITITPVDDNISEPDETVVLTLSASSVYTLDSRSLSQATILDSDGGATDSVLPTVSIAALDASASEVGRDSGTFRVSRTGSTAAGLTVYYTFGGTASIGNDYSGLSYPNGNGYASVVIPAGQSYVDLVVTPEVDTLVEGAETVVVSLMPNSPYALANNSAATITIADDPSNANTVSIAALDASASEVGRDSGTFRVSRTGSTAAGLTVYYTFGGTASIGNDYSGLSYPNGNGYASVVIPAGQSYVDLVVTPEVDTLVEGAETVVVSLMPNSPYALANNSAATITIADDPSNANTVSIAALDASASEVGRDSGTFRVSRTGSTAAGLTVYYTFGGTASIGNDYSGLSYPNGNGYASVVIPAGQSYVDLVVTPEVDTLVEGAETVVVSLMPNSPYALANNSAATITIADDPSNANTVSIAALDASASEVGRDSGTFRVSRTGSTAAGLTVYYTFGGTASIGNDYSGLSYPNGNGYASVVIPAGQSYVDLVVTPEVDTLVEGAETVVVSLMPNSPYALANNSAATITIADAAPDSPTNLIATLVTPSRIDLSWTDADDEQGYRVERNRNGSTSWDLIATPSADATSYSDSSVLDGNQYSYRVFATRDSLQSNSTNTVNITVPLIAPENLAVASFSGGRINLTWTDLSGSESSYLVEQSANGTSWQILSPTASVNATSFSVSGPFTASTMYYFRVRAYSSTTNVYSSYATISVLSPALPNTPLLTATVAKSDSSILVTWTDTSNETGYRLERSGDNSVTWIGIALGADIASYTDTGLQEAKTYTYRLVALNNNGESAYSITRTTATQPKAPTNLVVNVVSGSRIDLTWTDNSAVESSYSVEQSSNGTTWTVLSATAANSTSYKAPGPFNGSTTYSFRVRNYASVGGYSNYSNVTPVLTPALPNTPLLTATVAKSDSSILVTWTDTSNETGYRLERSGDNSVTWTGIALGADIASYTDTGLQEAKTYIYRLVALNNNGESAYSITRTTATQPKAPTNLVATFVSANRINLTWTDNSAAESSYIVEQSSNNGAALQRLSPAASSNATSYVATGPFNPSTTYSFRVRAYANLGGSSDYATTSSQTVAYPEQPKIFLVTGVSENSVRIVWKQIPNATSYLLERSLDGFSWSSRNPIAANSASTIDTGLQESTRYFYRLQAVNALGTSGSSPAASGITLPAAPTNVVATIDSADQATIRWTDRSNGETGFKVEQATSANGPWKFLGVANPNAFSLVVTEPFSGPNAYHFRVRAYNASGDSNSGVSQAVTPSYPEAPTGLVVTALAPTSVSLAWTAVTGATSYRIFRQTATGGWVDLNKPTTGTTFSDATIIAGTIYTYGVAAVSSGGLSGRALVGPVLASNGSDDRDNDGLTNLQEANYGTNATYFDSDGDLLPDGWEVQFGGFDPNSPDPTQGDGDGDGLTNLGEYSHDTDPTKGDTDGDGVSDLVEVDSGADPKDATDGGKPPGEDMKGKFRLTVGDPSGSHSERWTLKVGDVRYVSPAYGEVGFDDFNFEAGKSYEVRIDHAGSNRSSPDYDWMATITPTPGKPALPFFIIDENNPKLLQPSVTYGGNTNPIAGKVAQFYIPQLDADVDSDNNDGFNTPGRTKEEDRLERTTDGAKILTADTGDVDGDGVPDYADFDGIDGRKFVPIVLSLSDNLRYADPTKIEYSFTYDASDATATLRTGNGSTNDPYVYKRAPGSLRLWRKDATAARDKDGDYIHTGEKLTAEELGLQPGGSITLYVEAVAGSTSYLSVDVSAAVTGSKWSGTLNDSVYLASTETRFVEVGELKPVDNISLSKPAPVFSNVTIAIVPGSLHVSSDGSQILGTLQISGDLLDAALDLIAGSDGEIDFAQLSINGLDDVAEKIYLDVTKHEGSASILHPFGFSATFSTTLTNVALNEGWNLFKISCIDAYGFSGSATKSIEVDAIPGSGSDDDADEEDYFNSTFAVGDQSEVTMTGLGEFNPLLVELVGPTELLDSLEDITFGGQSYQLAMFGNGHYFATPGAMAPRAFMAAASPFLSVMPLEPAEPRNGVASFAEGFAFGLLDTGADVFDGIASLTHTFYRLAKTYNPISEYLRYRRGENLVTVEDSQRASSAFEFGKTVAGFAEKILQNDKDFIEATLVGDNAEVNRLGEEYRVAFEHAVEIFDAIRDAVSQLDDQTKGRILGRVIGEILLLVASAGAAESLKSGTILKVIPKLKSVPYIADNAAVVAKLDIAADFAAKLATTTMCFVAGTLVQTSEGPRPIETIRPGDLVLSRDEASGEQGYKPVLETVVTRPDRLYHVRYRTLDGIEAELVGTGEHPFYVVNRSGFIPAARLEVGDVLRLADGEKAEVTSLGIEQVVDGETFTTYNFEVADFHTYFVGDAGVWVHNASTLCEKAFSLYKQHIGYGETPEQSFHKVNLLISKWVTAGKLTQNASLKVLGDSLDSVAKQVRTTAGKYVPTANIWSPGPTNVNSSGINLWKRHWLKHMSEFPEYSNPIQYVDQAMDFTGATTSNGTKIVAEGARGGRTIRLVWDRNGGTNDFGVATVNLNGTLGPISTFFRLDRAVLETTYSLTDIPGGKDVFEQYFDNEVAKLIGGVIK